MLLAIVCYIGIEIYMERQHSMKEAPDKTENTGPSARNPTGHRTKIGKDKRAKQERCVIFSNQMKQAIEK
jgi:hypothetical protein